MNKNKKILPIVGIAIAVIAVCLVVFLLPNSENSNGELSWQEQYDLGVHYLSDGNYEEAIIAFTAAIEIDPKREEAYVGLADVYYATGDDEKAEEILAQMQRHKDEASTGSRTERIDRDDGSYLTREYDASGHLVCETRYKADNTINSIYEYEYDSNGNCIRWVYRIANGSIFQINDYDELGNCVRETCYNVDDGTMGYYWLNEYDASERCVRRTFYRVVDTVHYMGEIDEYEYANNSLHVVVRKTVFSNDGQSISDEINYTLRDKNNFVGDSSCNMGLNGADMFIYCIYEYGESKTVVCETHYKADGTVDYVDEY